MKNPKKPRKQRPSFVDDINHKLTTSPGTLASVRLSSGILNDTQIETKISRLDARAKKEWLMKAHAAGTVTDDQVAMAFYQYDLGSV